MRVEKIRPRVTGKATLEDWNLDSLDKIQEAMAAIARKAAAEAIDIALREHTHASLGRMHDKEIDPLTVSVRLGFDEYDGGPSLEFNLREIVADYYGYYDDPSDYLPIGNALVALGKEIIRRFNGG